MRFWIGLFTLTLAMPCRSETPKVSGEAAIVSHAKRIDIAKLDSALTPQPLEDWLWHGPTHVEKLEWRASDCDLKPGYKEPPAGYPLCVKVAFQRRSVSGWIILMVGTKRKGITEAPQFESGLVSTRADHGMLFENAKRLSDIPRLVSKLLAK